MNSPCKQIGLGIGRDLFPNQIPGIIIGSPKYYQLLQRYKKYTFYAEFGNGKDKVTNQAMSTVLSGTRFDAAGNSFLEDKPVINAAGLNEYGSFIQYIIKTIDISAPPWRDAMLGTVRTATTFIAVMTGGGVEQSSFNGEVDTQYIVSFWAWVNAGDALTNYRFFHGFAVEGEFTDIDLTTIPTLYSFILTTPTWAPIFNTPGFQDMNAGGGNTVHVTDWAMTDTKYLMPYAPNDTLGALTVPNNNADADEGNKWLLSERPKLVASLESQGQIDVIDWQLPTANASDVTGIINIITVNETAEGLLWYDATNKLLKATDGTNTVFIAFEPVAGQLYKLSIAWGTLSGTQMQLLIDDIPGSASAFIGAFPMGTNLSSAWICQDWQIKSKIIGHPTPIAWEV